MVAFGETSISVCNDRIPHKQLLRWATPQTSLKVPTQKETLQRQTQFEYHCPKIFEKVLKKNSYQRCKLAKSKEMVKIEPTNTRTAGIDNNHSAMLLLVLNVICGQRWMQ